jgi:hypothetical protein
MLLPLHVAAGGLAIVSGGAALAARKGGAIHRRSGRIFVYASLVMGISASILAFRKSATDPNVLGGFMTAYFVVTALTTVRARSSWTSAVDLVALAIAIGLALAEIVLAVIAFNSPRGFFNGVPFPMHAFMATTLILSASGDVRIMRAGAPRGGPRLARHLWRMCFALFIAAGSFFSIPARVAKVLPQPFTSAPMRALPILLVFAAMSYWLWKVRDRRAASALVRHDSITPGPAV